MKSFKQFISEEDVVRITPSATADKKETKKEEPILSPHDEVRKKLDFERSVMGMPEIDYFNFPMPKTLDKRLTQRTELELQAREQDPKYQEDREQRDKDQLQREAARLASDVLIKAQNHPLNAVNILSKLIPGFKGSPVQTAMMTPMNQGILGMNTLNWEAAGNLLGNPTYKHSNTEWIQQDREKRNK